MPRSGKSSGSVETCQRALWLAGDSALVLCAKPRAAADACQMAVAAGRKKDIIVVDFESGHCLNVIDETIRRQAKGNGLIDAVLQELNASTELVSRRVGQHAADDFFVEAKNQMTADAMFVDWMANGGISLRRVHGIMSRLPDNYGALEQPERHDVLRYLVEAEKNCPAQRRDELEMAAEYFTKTIPGMSTRTSSSIAVSGTVPITPMLRWPLSALFGGKTNLWPEKCIEEGKIVVLNMPGDDIIRRTAQIIFKRAWQKAIMRRKIEKGDESHRACGIWTDEGQNYITSFDKTFVEQSGEFVGYTVTAAQSINSYIRELGGGDKGKTATHEYLNLFGIRIGHRNLCEDTNSWFSKSLSTEKIWKKSTQNNVGWQLPQMSQGGGNFMPDPNAKGNKGYGENFTEHEEPVCHPRQFLGLARGGDDFLGNVIEGIVIVHGRRSNHDGRRYLKVRFPQNSWNAPYELLKFWKKQPPEARGWAHHVGLSDLLAADTDAERDEILDRWKAFWTGEDQQGGAK